MRSVFRIMGWIENSMLLVLIGLLFYINIPLKSDKNIYLKPGSITAIIAQLAQKGYDVSPIDKYLMVAVGQPQSGWIYFGGESLHRIDFLYRLTSAQSSFYKITLIPGETMVIFTEQLAKTLKLDARKLMEHYEQMSPFFEAGILAESYHIPTTLDEKETIRLLLKYSLNRYRSIAKQALGKWDHEQWRRILIVASIIQKEAANRKEMPLVASVIYNRLKKRMRLQMDGTLNYGRYSHVPVTPKRIDDDTSSYNTYKRRGLPDAPVCVVSVAAIQAAIRPAKTNYLYFMKNAKGTHDFSEEYGTHLKNIRKKRKRQP